MSYQDVRGWYEERDDEDGPPWITIPERPKPGERFMVRQPWDNWEVMEWFDVACELCHPSKDPSESCPCCKGTGLAGYQEPGRIAWNLSEVDARLLVFGASLVDAAARAVACCSTAHITELSEALARVKG